MIAARLANRQVNVIRLVNKESAGFAQSWPEEIPAIFFVCFLQIKTTNALDHSVLLIILLLCTKVNLAANLNYLKLYIRNMVCSRCKMAVKSELEKAGLIPDQVELGEVTLKTAPEPEQLEQVRNGLNSLGFELIDDQKSKLIEKIKTQIIELVHHDPGPQPLKLSAIISDKLHHDYTYLSNLFSSVEGQTIEKYHIMQKIERVKELLVYDEFTLSEIAYQTGYSSAAHLSAQFKQVTGLTTSAFKALKGIKRTNLENL